MSTGDQLTRLHYLQLATQYYIATRHAVLCWSVPVAGNLAHHTLEMLINAGLCQVYSQDDLKRKFSKHNLPAMWSEFKSLALVHNRNLSKFNSVIAQCQQWEEIRYPNFPGDTSLTMSLRPAFAGPGKVKGRVYSLNLAEIDEFFKEIILALNINPGFIRTLIASQDALATYERANQHKLW
jgi:hypothetical protein